MTLATGTRLGPYEILGPLGEGGMGEVYRARDARLGRDVAVKVLPESFAKDAERLARFEREAKVLASLNHPHIAAIYGLEETDGGRALVMELVEGPTLAERIAQGPLALDEALPIARQIAEALEAAHERGIVHRDLKPANVKLSADGRVKVLDFGLAKALDPAVSGQLVDSPTITAMATQHGVILGTAAYMSPEQARGQAVDKRSDIWAFGCVLYEMLTGKRVFEAETVSDSLAAILRGEVDWSALPATTPLALRRLLAHCLEKDRRKRLHDIGDASFELDESLSGAPAYGSTATAPAAAPRSPAWQRVLPWAMAALALAVAIWLALARPVESPSIAQPRRLEIPGISVNAFSGIALSPDGREVLAGDDTPARSRILRRSLGSFEIQTIAGAEDSFNPFFSPDGREIAIFLYTRQLCVVPLAGGTRRCLAEADGYSTGHWGADGTIVYSHTPTATDAKAGLRRVAAQGGEATWLTEVKRDRDEQAHTYPQLLPDGRHVLFTIARGGRDALAAVPLAGGEPRVVLEGARRGRYLRSGHLVYVADTASVVRAIGFDLERLAPLGQGVDVLADIVQTSDATPAFEISDSGTLAYSVGGQFAGQFNVGAVDRSGRVTQLFAESASWAQPRVSPDGTSILLRRAQTPECHLWLFDLGRKSLSRLTLDGDSHDPHWVDGGARIVYSVQWAAGLRQVFSQPADGGAAAQLVETPFAALATGVSSDGRYVALVNDDRRGRNDIFVHDRESGATAPWLETEFDEDLAEFSPDGRWLAYTSNETGRSEVYVRPFPGPGPKYLVSTQGGTGALWSRDGREIFYAEGARLMRVAVHTAPRFSAGEPEQLFSNPDLVWERPRNYDVTPDGRSFIMITRQPGSGTRSLRLVLDWVAELERLVPGAGR